MEHAARRFGLRGLVAAGLVALAASLAGCGAYARPAYGYGYAPYTSQAYYGTGYATPYGATSYSYGTYPAGYGYGYAPYGGVYLQPGYGGAYVQPGYGGPRGGAPAVVQPRGAVVVQPAPAHVTPAPRVVVPAGHGGFSGGPRGGGFSGGPRGGFSGGFRGPR